MSTAARAQLAPNLARAEAAWGTPLPDWVLALAEACDKARSQAKAGALIGYSAGVVNAVLGKAYKGDLRSVEAKVRGRFMGACVECPVLGSISTADCLDHQKRPLMATNPQRVALWRACRTCPNRRS